jgi:chromate transporter
MARESDALLGGSAGRASLGAFLASFWTMGLVAFGGPSAHVALMHNKYVAGPPRPPAPRVPDSTFVELFALSSALPGPGSTQLATSLGATFGGLPGAALTFAIWQLPGSLLMTCVGLWFHSLSGSGAEDAKNFDVDVLATYFTGLISAAFAMVVIAAMKISAKTCGNSKVKTAVCVVTASLAVLVPPEMASWLFVLLLIGGGAVVLYDNSRSAPAESQQSVSNSDDDGCEDWESQISDSTGAACLAFFVVASAALFLWTPRSLGGQILRTFWKVGATGFGGGTVVIPLILTECAAFLPVQTFLFGFGLISLAPGPMFNLAWFLGAALDGVRGACLAALGLFGPGIVLLLGLLPFWERVRRWAQFRVFLAGVNAAATGLIVAGVWMLLHKSLIGPLAYSLAIIAASLTLVYEISTPLVIIGCGFAGAVGVAAGLGQPV